MISKNKVSEQTMNNWLVDSLLIISALLVSISGIYFLFLPVGGYQGGRNPYYGIRILFERHTWGDLHTWTGVLMIAVIAIHLPLHWDWIVNMSKRSFKVVTDRKTRINQRSQFNVFVNLMVGLSFTIAAVSGVYLLFVPGGPQSAENAPIFLFSHTTWDLIHTWSGTLLVIAALTHIVIHWKWVTKVTSKILLESQRRVIDAMTSARDL